MAFAQSALKWRRGRVILACVGPIRFHHGRTPARPSDPDQVFDKQPSDEGRPVPASGAVMREKHSRRVDMNADWYNRPVENVSFGDYRLLILLDNFGLGETSAAGLEHDRLRLLPPQTITRSNIELDYDRHGRGFNLKRSWSNDPLHQYPAGAPSMAAFRGQLGSKALCKTGSVVRFRLVVANRRQRAGETCARGLAVVPDDPGIIGIACG